MALHYFVPIFILNLIAVHAANTVNISVYYESLCPDSKRFITNQLTPVYEKYETQINLDLVPFGREIVTQNDDGTYHFTCQHGPEECYGNQFHACAINKYFVTQSAKFVECSMGSTDPASDDTLNKCSEEAGIDAEVLDECYTSGLGAELLAKNGERTNSLENLDFIPTIVFNDKFDKSLQNGALTDLNIIVEEFLNEKY